ncbi:TetR/AcrR family transcriptional regulator [Nocardioides alkalitolerans]|uniref:TetR/AcrR family transcriptional regulator n=1 Tax=Nocardioides alkalitolerans TaxID=281714 RepID=UPI00048FB1A4|nr:TetR/AcrR family transcriptional regulator [Nocardioides alkalitolerans]
MARTTQRPRRTARQDALLDRLVTLFAAEGFARLTLDDIAARLSCSKTTLYALASSKQELVVEAARQYFRVATAEVEAGLDGVEGCGPRIEAYLRGVAACLQPLSPAFLEDLSGFAPAAAVYRRNTEAAADRIRQLVSAGVESGELRPVHAGFVGEMVAATMFEIQRGRLFERLELTDAEAYAELATFVVTALTD